MIKEQQELKRQRQSENKMYNPFLGNKASPIKSYSRRQQDEPKRLSGLIVNSNSMSNEQFFILLQEIGDEINEQMDSNNILSLEGGTVQIQFSFLSKLNIYERSYLSNKDIIILLCNPEDDNAIEQLDFIQEYLKQTDPNNAGMNNTKLFFFVQNYEYNIKDSSDHEYQIQEILTEYPFINVTKVSSDNAKTLKQSIKPIIISFALEEADAEWKPIMAQDEEHISNQLTGNMLEQLDEYKNKRTISPSPSPSPYLSFRKSIFENPIVSLIKQQQEEKRMQEEALKQQEQIPSYSVLKSNQKSNSKSIFDSPMLMSSHQKRDTSNSIIYSTNKKNDFSLTQSPLSTLRYREDISDRKHQINLKVSPYKRELTQNYSYPKLSSEKEPPVFKTSLMQGEDLDDLMQFNINSPLTDRKKTSPIKFSKQLRDKQDKIQKEQESLMQKNFDQFNPKENDENNTYLQGKSYNQDQTQNRSFRYNQNASIEDKSNQQNNRSNIFNQAQKSTTPSKYPDSNVQLKNKGLIRNKSSLGIKNSQQQERATTPNRLTQSNRLSQKQLIPSQTSNSSTSSKCLLKLNIEVQNRIVQIDVEEHDTAHSLTYKLLQKCNQSGQIKQVRQITSMIEQKLKHYLTNVEKYFKNHTKPQVNYICKQNRTILQELTDNQYTHLQKNQKLPSYQNQITTIPTAATQFDKTPEKYQNTSHFGDSNYFNNNYNNQKDNANIGRQQQSNMTASKNLQSTNNMSQSMLTSLKLIGEVQIQGNVNGQLQDLSLKVVENISAEVQTMQFLQEYNLDFGLQEQIIQQIQNIQQMHRQTNTYSDMFQENREQQNFIKEIKAKYKFENNVLFQNIQKSASSVNNFRVNLELENGKTVRFNFTENDNLPKAISIFCINHKLSSKNQKKLQNICEQSIKYTKQAKKHN